MFMLSPSDITERHAATLAELAEIGMVIAREIQGDVQAAETPEAKARAVAWYPRVARAVRQCLALEAKFVRDAARDQREDAKAGEGERDARRERRRMQVRLRLTRLIHDRYDTGAEYDEGLEGWLCELRDCLHEQVLDPEVLDQPFDVVFQRICADLGLPPPGEDEDEDDQDDQDDEGEEERPLLNRDRRVLRPGPDDITYPGSGPPRSGPRDRDSS